MEPLKPQVLRYSDYRSFLRDYYLYRKIIQPQWGFIQWAQEANLRCPSLLNMIVKRHRHASRELVEVLIGFLNFTLEESSHFKNLVAVQRLGLAPAVPTRTVNPSVDYTEGTGDHGGHGRGSDTGPRF